MTRRICAMQHNNKFYVSQEFNGDRAEQMMFGLPTLCEGNWKDLIHVFDGSVTLEEFASAVRNMENAFHYAHEELEELDELRPWEELWVLTKEKLVLHSEYGVLVEAIR